MNATKRFLALAMALVMLLPLAACANQTDKPSDNGDQSTDAVTEAATEDFPNIEKQDYKEETLRMIGFDEPGSWYYAASMSDEKGSVHVLNNTIYEMNTMVEEYLNISIEYDQIDTVRTGGEIFETVQPSIMSGDDLYQICILHPYYSYTNFITQNYAMDFKDLPDFDADQPYWNAAVMEQLSINDHYFIGLGDFCKYQLNMIYCNKDLMKDAGRTVPYDLVRNGTWTLDEFLGMTAELYRDNGDGKRNNADTYGFAAMWDANGSAFMQGCDIYVATRNDEDHFELSLYGDRLEDMYEKLYNWSKDESTYLWTYGERNNEAVIVPFQSKRAYFTHDKLGTQYLDAEFSVGMLPMPKYDKEQTNYAHVNWGNNIVLPSTIKNKNMVGQALELMGYYSKTLVQQKYYDEVLQLRVSEAPDDRDMVELIYGTVVYDPGIAFCDGSGQLLNLVYLPCFGIRNNSKNITSYYRTNAKSAQKWLDNLFVKVE